MIGGRRGTRGRSLKWLHAAQAHADVGKREQSVLAAKLGTALRTGGERSSVLLAGKTLLASTLGTIETLGFVAHGDKIRSPSRPRNLGKRECRESANLRLTGLRFSLRALVELGVDLQSLHAKADAFYARLQARLAAGKAEPGTYPGLRFSL